MPYSIRLIAVVLFITHVAHVSCTGSISLGELTFEKVIRKFPAVLVKFDVAFPYGDKYEVFKKLSEETSKNPDLLLAEVGVKDYGEKENEALALKYKAKKDQFPVLKLFIQNKEKPFTFPENVDFTVENIKSFIRDKSGVYIGMPGCLKPFDEMAKNFMERPQDREQLHTKAEAMLEKTNDDEKLSAKVYVTIMKKTIEFGSLFINNEVNRVKNLLKGKLTTKKQTEITEKLNILKSFSVISKDEL